MTKFSDLKLDPKVLKAVVEAGYENPTPIQEGAIPPALEGRDVLGIAQTGTGKTASFTLPMITMLGRGRARARMPRSLVLCPTRELAAQVAENFDTYAKHTKLTKALLIGGVSFGEQDKLIDRGVDVLIATPGRLLDHFERGKLLLTGVQIMVVDEADRMLDMGFIPDIERIFQLTPFTRQTLFFSATMAPEIERITNTFLHAPERIEIARQASASETITQRLIEITPSRKDQTAKQKRELLRALISAEGDDLKNAIIFCNRKTDVDIVAKSLQKYGFDASPIHGDLDQSHRTRTLDGFREGKLRLLVASDVAARGLDIPAVSHVFNFDLPSHAEDYVHRIGRTGRAGRLGTSISISTPADEKYLTAIEALVKKELPRSPLPDGFEPTTAAQSAPKERREERGDKSGSRRRGRRDDNRRPERDRPDAVPPSPVEDRKSADQEPALRPQRDQQPREDRRRSHREDRGPAIVGMGDHIPQFMLVSLDAELAKANEEASDTRESESHTAATDAATPSKPKRRSRNSSRSSARNIDAQIDSTVTEQKATEPAASETPVSVTHSADDQNAQSDIESGEAKAPELLKDAPATKGKPRKPRTRKPKAEAEAEPTVTAPEEAPKPKRTRRKKTEKASEDDAPEQAVDSSKTQAPRSRRKKAVSDAETPLKDATNELASSDDSEK